MNVLVTASAHFVATADGELWCENSSLDYAFWSRYLDVFDGVSLMVRAESRLAAPSGWNRATGVGVRGVPVPDFRSVSELLRFYPNLTKRIRGALAKPMAVNLRVPCPLGEMLWRYLDPGRPYSVEVVGDPHGTFAPGAVHHPLRRAFRWWFGRQLRRQCWGACASSYVTEDVLQSIYPSAAGAFSTHYSSIDLTEEAFSKRPRSGESNAGRMHLVTVGSLSRPYKATDVLIDAVARCVESGLNVDLTIVGEGRHRSRLEDQVAAAGLESRVRFTGQLTSRAAIRRQLDQADLFILPSRHEGLPKALIEAMARGLPCIGSDVGGIPELLSAEDLVPSGDVNALAARIQDVVADGKRLARMSARNLERARAYRSDALRARRVKFYRYLETKTEEWLAERGAAGASVVGERSEDKVA